MQEINLKELYKKWPFIKRYLKSLGCMKNDAEDIFQEAILILFRKIEDNNFELTVEPIYYVQNTCKLIWYNQMRKEEKKITFQLEKDVEDIQDEWFEKESKLQSIEEVFLKIGERCQEILKLFYGDNLSMEMIAKKIGLRNEKVVKAQKYRCIHKIKELVHLKTTEI